MTKEEIDTTRLLLALKGENAAVEQLDRMERTKTLDEYVPDTKHCLCSLCTGLKGIK
jgi:hypothetical protein